MDKEFFELVEDLQCQDRQGIQDVTEDQIRLSQIAGGGLEMGVPLAMLGFGAPKTASTRGNVKPGENEGAFLGGGPSAGTASSTKLTPNDTAKNIKNFHV